MRSLPDMPRNDWEEEFIVSRVIGIDPTKSAPRGALRFWGKETRGRNSTPGGFHVVNFDEVVEVIGTMGAEKPRPTLAEVRQEERAAKRATLREERRKRRKGKAQPQVESAEDTEEAEEDLEERTLSKPRRHRRVRKKKFSRTNTHEPTEDEELEIVPMSKRRKGRRR